MIFVLKKTAVDGPYLEVFADDEEKEVLDSLSLTGSKVVDPDHFLDSSLPGEKSIALVIKGVDMYLKLETNEMV